MHNLSQSDNFILKFEESIKQCWDQPAVSDFHLKSTTTYGEFAKEIETNKLLWKAAGLNPGDKIAITARNSAAWAKIFFSTQVNGYVSVQIFPGFTPGDTENLVNHSETRILYIEKSLFEPLKFENMPMVIAAIELNTGELLAFRGNFNEIYAKRDQAFNESHPDGLTPEDIDYSNCKLDTLSSIMYTSGSTGNPKGVMLTNKNFSAQVYVLPKHAPYRRGENIVNVLPFAHIFGMTVDMIVPFCIGMHVVVLGLPPTPTFLKPALRAYKPHLFFSVPLVLTKLIEDTLGDFIHSKSGAAKLADYKNNPDFCEALETIFMKALGGEIEIFVTGGAAIPEQFEELFVTKLGLPFVTGYGLTETAPVITLGHLGKYKLRECGEYFDEVFEVKINSPHPDTIPGEILVKGLCVFSGYFKNEKATSEAFTEDGWFHTGDMATMDKDNSVFIVGRCKNMILTSNGQNIYPEEIEVVLNDLPGVAESLIVNRGERLVALIVPDQNRLEGMDAEAVKNIMDANINVLNTRIPGYSHVCGYELRYEPFVKTPKGSIRRFMYE